MLAITLITMFVAGACTGVIGLIALVTCLDSKSDTQTSIVIHRTPVHTTVVQADRPFKTDILI